MDIVTNLPPTDHGHETIYAMVDRLYKFTYFIPYKHTVRAADLVKLFLVNMVTHHKMPALIVSDCGLWFTSYFWCSLIHALDCKHSLSIGFHPEMDGLI